MVYSRRCITRKLQKYKAQAGLNVMIIHVTSNSMDK